MKNGFEEYISKSNLKNFKIFYKDYYSSKKKKNYLYLANQ